MANNQDEVARIRDFYDKDYYSKVPDVDDVQLPWHYRYIAKNLQPLKNKKVLDVACGTGEWLHLLMTMGAEPSGIDLSDKAIKICKQRFNSKNFHAGQAEKLPFQDNKFDLVTCLGSMEHFVDPAAAIKEMVRTAKSSADFLILVPNSDFLSLKLGLYKGTNQASIKEDLRTLEEWRKLFENNGLVVSEMYRDLHILDKEWIVKNGLLKAPLRLLIGLMLIVWPLKWQYQVYFLCKSKI